MLVQNLLYPPDNGSGKLFPEKEKVLFLSYRQGKLNKLPVKVISIKRNDLLHVPNESVLLKQQIAEGDERAFTLLYRGFSEKIRKYIYVLSGKQPDCSEDIVQDIFLKIWEIRKKLPLIESFDNYLFCMVKNYLANTSSKMATHKKAYLEIERTITKYDNVTENDILYREAPQVFKSALYRLPVRTKQAFELREYYNMNTESIALEMKITVSTVKAHLQTAKKKIRLFVMEQYN